MGQSMTRLILIVLSMILAILISFNAGAQESRYTLFAVDLSLSPQQRNMAYDVIREVTLIKTNDHTIGLTLFDDTVRRFIAPAKMDKAQILAINETLADSLVSVRSTSNLAVGIERAIDNLGLNEPANLVIFARGIIDTPSQDPRARFREWLEVVLLPQAAEENISITLVVPQQQFIDPIIKQAFISSNSHHVLDATPGERAAPALISLLGIADRPYGEVDLSLSPENAPPTPTVPQPDDDTAIELTNDAATSRFDLAFIAKILFLIIATTVFCGILYWRYRVKKNPSNHSQTTVPSSTYLPLTEKPATTMNSWMKDNEDALHSDSLDNGSLSDNEAPTRPSIGKPSGSKQKEQEPWE